MAANPLAVSVPASFSVRARQKDGLVSMLASCGAEDDSGVISTTIRPVRDSGAGLRGGPAGAQPPTSWKVLVYDAAGRDIIAPLMKVADLRAMGVTLHMMLGSARQPIQDVSAVYFVAPTEQNVDRIAADIKAKTYHDIWLNFTSHVPRSLMERLADKIADIPQNPNQPSCTVARVYDMYTDFVSLEDNLFSLNVPNAYRTLNASDSTDNAIQATLALITDRIFDVLVTLGVVPIIRAQRSGAAEMVAGMLDKRIREALVGGQNVFSNPARTSGSFVPPATRPLLVLLDRSIDLPVMLHHTWTYQALAHDSLSLHLNRVSIPPSTSDAGAAVPSKPKTYDLDKNDEFWATNAGLPFPMVAEAVETALQKYKEKVAELNKSASTVGNEDVPPLQSLQDAMAATPGASESGNLAAAISSLPELTKKKHVIDLHTNIATALLDNIRDRGLDGYYQIEEELLSRPQSFDVERVLALIQSDRGNVTDKLRLFLIYFLCIKNVPPQDVSKCTSALQRTGCTDLRALTYLQGIKAFTSTMASVGAMDQGSASSSINSSYAAVLGTLSQVANNVQNLVLTADKALPTARVVSSLMDQKGEADVVNGYACFDPQGPKGSTATVATKRIFEEAIVFVVGPGNYIEYQNCMDHICSTVRTDGTTKKLIPNGRKLLYGATELRNGPEFVAQLEALGGPSPEPASTPEAGQ